MKYIFLDFNGTVLDDVDLCLNLLNRMLTEKGHKPVSYDNYKEIFQFPVIEYYKKAGFTFEGYSFEELADYFIDEYTRRNNAECKIFEDFKDFVDLLHASGYKVVLCSASKLNLLIDQLNEFKIIQYFDDVIGLDNHFAASKLELAKQYVSHSDIDLENSYFIGDTTHDAEVAVACGIKPLLVDRGHQSKEVLSKANSVILGSLFETANYLKTINKNNKLLV